MTANDNGTFAEDTLKLFERLPPSLREAHRNAIFDYAVTPDLRALARGTPVSHLVEELAQSDVGIVRQEAVAHWGEQARDYLAAQRPRRLRDYFDKPPRARL